MASTTTKGGRVFRSAPRNENFGFSFCIAEITMLDVLRQLETECGEKAFPIFEWYCQAYNVSVGDMAPASVRREVFGL